MSKNNLISQNTIDNTCFSQEITVFHGRQTPERSILVGYGAVLDALKLPVPLPAQLALISKKRRQYQTSEWIVFTPRHQPIDTLYGHLVFALKYEGVNLLLFKKLFDKVDKTIIEDLVKNEPLSQYSRKIWFLYEWLLQVLLNIPQFLDPMSMLRLLFASIPQTMPRTQG